ncbi:hypothetical protein [Nocardiopsis sp. CC223A]|uniref:hypothetical protein n=1 Tax=Nocardiopsis sp. CC223A TaxID=3044051 RepID=UPI00278C6827|nr:hypothetical protein [Nocardiopsis sp. CC223A]
MSHTTVRKLSLAGMALAGALAFGLTACAGGATSSPLAGGGTGTVPTAIQVGATTQDGTNIIASTSVGKHVFLLGRNGDDYRFSAFVDGDPGESWENFDGTLTPAPDGIALSGAGNFPDAALGGIATVHGSVGEEVTGVEIRTNGGDDVTAEVADGYFIAAWEGDDFYDRDTLGAVFVLRLKDGGTSEIGYLDVTEG